MKSLQNLSYKTLFTILFLSLAGIVFFIRIGKPTQKVSAAWWDEMWHYRKEINIGYTGTTTATNTRIKILSNYDLSFFVTNNKIQSDLDDLRFTDINGNLINYWIEDSTSNSVDIWCNVPTLNNPNTTIYMYYGNPSATSKSDGSSIFGTSVNPAGLNCTDIRNHHNSSGGNGVYWIDPDGSGTNSPFQNYCDMTTDNGGWTLVMKLNGSLNTFEYDSSYWTNTTTYHPESSDFDNNEAKLQSYNTVAFDQINLYMKDIGGTNLNKVTLTQTSSSLYNLISGGTFTATSIGRTGWLSLLENVATQVNCNQEGFNVVVPMTRSRIGMAMNGENDCNSCDNLIGFGNNKTGHPWGPYVTVGGGVAATNPVKTAYGWIFVRATLQSTDLSNLSINLSSSEELSPAPVAYWKFDEGVGTTIYDSSPNEKHGYFGTTVPSWADESQCINGKCLSFNGTQSAYSSYDVSWNNSNSISINFWVKPQNTTDATGSILGKQYPAYEWSIYQSGSSVSLVYWNSSGGHTNGMDDSWGSILTANKWTNLTYTWDGSTSKFYADGKLVKTKTATDPSINMNQTNNMMFGGNIYTWGDTYFRGYLDEVKIYPYARTADQIKQDYNSRGSMSGSSVNLGVQSNTSPSLKSSLIAHWKFEEGNSTNAYDSINSKGYSIDNAISWQSNDCRFGKCIYGTGATLTNNIVSNFDYNIIKNSYENSTWTLSAWVKPNGNQSGNERVIVGRSGCHSGLMVNVNSFMFQIFNEGCSGTKAIVYTPPNMTDWYYLSAVYNQRNMYLYVNGKLVGTNTMSENIFTHDNNLFIGGVGFWAFKGWIDEVKIYNTALTPEEIKQDYNAGSVAQFGSTTQNIGGTTTSLDYCIPGDTSFCASPVAEYNFEENTGTITKDISGNNNTGTINSATWTVGKKNTGAGLNFSGSSQYITIEDSTSLKPTTNVTVEAWFNTTNKTLNQRMVSKTNGGGYSLSMNENSACPANTLCFLININGSYYSASYPSSNLSNNTWYHTAGSYDGTTVRLFLNGSNIGTTASISNTITQNTAKLCIGSESAATNCYAENGFFSGKIDDVKIYNYARTPAQIAYDYNRGAPIGWWKLDECQGSTAFDSSGIGNTGVISIGQSGTQTTLGTCQTGTSAAWTNGKNGKINSSLNFDGVDDYISVPVTIKDYPFSISGWIKSDTQNTEQTFFSQKKTGGIPWIRFFKATDNLLSTELYNGGSPSLLDSNTTIQPNTYYHITTVVSSSNISIYINGKLDNSTANGVTFTWSDFNNANIGFLEQFGRYFNGQIDDVRIYNYALTSEQVKQVYNGGAVNFQ